jgi:hypothetical protein
MRILLKRLAVHPSQRVGLHNALQVLLIAPLLVVLPHQLLHVVVQCGGTCNQRRGTAQTTAAYYGWLSRTARWYVGAVHPYAVVLWSI